MNIHWISGVFCFCWLSDWFWIFLRLTFMMTNKKSWNGMRKTIPANKNTNTPPICPNVIGLNSLGSVSHGFHHFDLNSSNRSRCFSCNNLFFLIFFLQILISFIQKKLKRFMLLHYALLNSRLKRKSLRKPNAYDLNAILLPTMLRLQSFETR